MVRYVMISEMLKGGKCLKTDEIYPYILIYVDTFVRLYVYTYANIHIHRYIAIHTHTHTIYIHIHTHTPNIHISQLYSKQVFWTLLLRIPCVPLECPDLRLTEVSKFIQMNFLHVAKWKWFFFCFLGFFLPHSLLAFPRKFILQCYQSSLWLHVEWKPGFPGQWGAFRFRPGRLWQLLKTARVNCFHPLQLAPP